MNTITKRAKAGAALLDKLVPDWAEKINLNEFDISSPFSCVLYSVFGGYNDGMAKLYPEAESYHPEAMRFSQEHGFEIEYEGDLKSLKSYGKLLTEAWRVEILQRLAKRNLNRNNTERQMVSQ